MKGHLLGQSKNFQKKSHSSEKIELENTKIAKGMRNARRKQIAECNLSKLKGWKLVENKLVE